MKSSVLPCRNLSCSQKLHLEIFNSKVSSHESINMYVFTTCSKPEETPMRPKPTSKTYKKELDQPDEQKQSKFSTWHTTLANTCSKTISQCCSPVWLSVSMWMCFILFFVASHKTPTFTEAAEINANISNDPVSKLDTFELVEVNLRGKSVLLWKKMGESWKWSSCSS